MKPVVVQPAKPPRVEDETSTFESAEAWEAWLAKHHAKKSGVWLRIAKVASGETSVTYAEAIDSALCHGWIDGQKRPLDASWWLQRFTPRTSRSIWSKINRDKVQRLVEAGRMRPAGQAEVDRAQADGRWEAAYDGAAKMAVPDDLQSALDAEPAAQAFFATLNSTHRYAVLFRVHGAKRAETRARRIERFVAMLARGERIHEK